MRRARSNACIMPPNGLFILKNKEVLQAAVLIISIADGPVIIQKPQDISFLPCCATLPMIKHSGLRKPSMLPLKQGSGC